MLEISRSERDGWTHMILTSTNPKPLEPSMALRASVFPLSAHAISREVLQYAGPWTTGLGDLVIRVRSDKFSSRRRDL